MKFPWGRHAMETLLTLCEGNPPATGDPCYDVRMIEILFGGYRAIANKRTHTWWRLQMETFSASPPICVGNSPVTGEIPVQRPVTRNFDGFIDLRLNKRLSKQWWGWWFATPSRPLWRHCNLERLNIVTMDHNDQDLIIHRLGGRWQHLVYTRNWSKPNWILRATPQP